MEKIKLFISYSHKDDMFLQELKEYVNEISCPKITVWDDGRIDPGNEWDKEIKKHLQQADIVLMLISQLFLNSKYIQSEELRVALDRHDLNECRVIPIFTRTCNLRGHPQITKLQGLPKEKKFLNEMELERDTHYARIQEELNELADELLLMKQPQSITKPGQTPIIKEVERLRTNKSIFLSVPSTEEGLKRRRDFIYQVEGKVKYEGWPYQIVPSVKEGETLLQLSHEQQRTFLSEQINSSVFAIQILDSTTELEEGLGRMQYDQICKSQSVIKTAIWFLNPQIKDKLSSEINLKIRMNPVCADSNYENLFQIINDMERDKEKRITELKAEVLPTKKVFMFYDFSKDHGAALRINLKKKIEEFKDISVRLSAPNDSLEKGRELLGKCDGALIFYGETDSQWFLMRQSMLFEAAHIQAKAICLDEPDIQVKLDSDVAAEFLTIKGTNELDNGVKNFVSRLT